jgi:hypothetical protein
MNEEHKTQAESQSKITAKSDWMTAIGAVVAFAGCCLLLKREIKHFVSGHFVQSTHISRDYFGIPTGVFLIICSILGFSLAFGFSKKPVKVACFLMGINFAVGSVMGFFHLSPGTFYAMAMISSVARQIAVVIALVVIAQWLKSAIKRASPSEL